jgi:hypothetical protein
MKANRASSLDIPWYFIILGVVVLYIFFRQLGIDLIDVFLRGASAIKG